MDVKRFGALIRARREELKLTQQEVADFIGRQPAVLSRWERGFPNMQLPDPDEMRRLSEILALPEEEILIAAGYLQPVGDEPDASDQQADFYARLAYGTDWSQVPEEQRERVLRELEYARRAAPRQRN